MDSSADSKPRRHFDQSRVGAEDVLWDNLPIRDSAQRFDVHLNQITDWRRRLVATTQPACSATKSDRRDPATDVKALHAKIGQHALDLPHTIV